MTSVLKRLDERSELHVVGMLMEWPALFLGEICQELQRALRISVSPTTICRLLKCYGILVRKLGKLQHRDVTSSEEPS